MTYNKEACNRYKEKDPERYKKMRGAMAKKRREANIEKYREYESKQKREARKNNPEKVRAAQRRSIEKSKEQYPEKFKKTQRESYLRFHYGITEKQFYEILLSQDSKCAICGSEFPSKKETHIDHDHYSGMIRGILCRKCNNGLGHFNDNSDLIYKAFLYLLNAAQLDT